MTSPTNRTDEVARESAKLLCKLGYIDKRECLIEDVEKAIAPLIASAITSAVAEERERCAVVAEELNCDHLTCERDWCDDIANEVAEAIRNQDTNV